VQARARTGAHTALRLEPHQGCRLPQANGPVVFAQRLTWSLACSLARLLACSLVHLLSGLKSLTL